MNEMSIPRKLHQRDFGGRPTPTSDCRPALEKKRNSISELAFSPEGGDTHFSRSYYNAFACFGIFAILVGGLGGLSAAPGECFAREGKKPIINKLDMSVYRRKLFLTSDEMARYLFLTNRRDDGDRSAAVYQAPLKKGSLPGNYWVTSTVASDSLINNRAAHVRRFDAPLPTSAAVVVHELWLALCQKSHTDEEALPSAPTGLFSVVGPKGTRLTVVTVSLLNEHSLCISMLNLSGLLDQYAKLPATKRAEAAREIERESNRMLRQLR